MYKIQQNPRTVDKKYRYGTITEADRQTFIDDIFFPAFRTNVHPSNALRFCKNDEQARRKDSSVDFMWQSDLKATIDSMKEIINNPANNRRFEKFRNFYLISFAFGGIECKNPTPPKFPKGDSLLIIQARFLSGQKV